MTAATGRLDLPDDKAEARRIVRAARREWRDAGHHARDGEALAGHGVQLVRESGARTVTLFTAWAVEPPTAALTRALLDAGVRVLVPITLPSLDLDWAEVRALPEGDVVAEDDLELGPALGLDAIAQADLVLTPGLAVGSDGKRLGQGGGCYDRTLPRRRPGVPVVTLLHEAELVERVPCEPHDLPVDGVLRPSGVTWF
ncbi:5-formyltetrahydrofolate cyclo-ligase [Kytococcus sedentarius]|uniref:5-formyltetrahydrofolate cyclo-ligase n=1 Tax=Kytococcus sedentarius TaxID=1276 RepID=UPI0035BC820E